MKKTIVIIFAMLILSALSMNAQETPNITLFHNTSFDGIISGMCDSDGVDTIVCPNPEFIGTPADYMVYHTDTLNITLVHINNDNWYFSQISENRVGASCHYYSINDNFYCIVGGTNGGLPVFSAWEISGSDYTTYTNLANVSGTGDSDTPVTHACDLRPLSDEIYCWSNIAQNTTYQVMRKYDIGDDTWTILKDVPSPTDATSNRPLGSGCQFLHSTDMWCYGGWETSINTNFTIYNVVLNTTTTIQNNGFQHLSYLYLPANCRWHSDMLYCFSMTDASLLAFDDLYYYNATSDATGFIADVFDESYFSGLASIGDTDYLIWGYDNTIGNERPEIWKFQWSSTAPVTPPAPPVTGFVASHTSSDIPNVIIDFLVELGIGILPFVGIMVIAFLGLVILPAYIKRRK